MNLLVTFVIAIVVALFGLAWIAVIIDKMTSPFVSLVVFFPLLFATIWLTWRLSVKFTEPKTTPHA
ncbi:MAG: hypothetical protein K2Y71_30085 [Xanthobacteraceae bacterium]|nr:hypothetical protein [Xanthobacteraceae bacterium]MBX9826922.1 hypothetical protein [Xanthobacteraceae bacterium]